MSAKLLRPTWAEISLPALRQNFALLRKLAGTRQLMAVVKADAYGHGATPVAACLAAEGADWFGVATVEEAVELREAGIEQPILLLGGLYMSDPADLLRFRLVPGVSSTARLETYAECAHRMGRPVDFHLKIDTGMGRLGLPPDRLHAFADHLQELAGPGAPYPGCLNMKGMFTHLAAAEDLVSTQTDDQLAVFNHALSEVRSRGYNPEYIHVSNSAALLARHDITDNLVRIGALLYGSCLPLIYPAGAAPEALPDFKPVLAFKSRIVFLKDVRSGVPLGYGASYYTRRPSRIATAPVGYADGLNRGLSNRGWGLVRGQEAPIVGAVSMDLTLFDVTGIPGAAVGDEVTLIGASGDKSISVQDVARLTNTVPYEVLTSIGKRVPRLYTGQESSPGAPTE